MPADERRRTEAWNLRVGDRLRMESPIHGWCDGTVKDIARSRSGRTLWLTGEDEHGWTLYRTVRASTAVEVLDAR